MPLDPPWMKTRALLGALVTILCVAALLWLGYALRVIGLLLILSILFAYVLAPLVARCERGFAWRGRRHGLSRQGAIGAVYLACAGLIALAISQLVPRIARQLGALDEAIPLYFANRHDWGDSLLARYHSYRLPPALRHAFEQAGAQASESLHQEIRDGLFAVAGAMRFLPWLLLIPVIAAFLLVDAPVIRNSMLTLLPVGRVRWRGADFFEDANQTIAHVVRAQLVSCLLIGVACTIGFFIIQVPFALLLGVSAGFLELIPMAGPLLMLVVAGLVAAARAPHLAVYTVLFLIGLRALQDNVIYPRLIAASAKMHPLVVILCLLCGTELAGVTGLFLAIPVTAFLSVSYRHLHRRWSSDGLLAELFVAGEAEPLPAPAVRTEERPRSASGVALNTRAAPVKSLRVLVVDDDDNARTLLAALLRGRGALVSTAGSAPEALALLAAQRFDALLSDIGMPGQDGFELIRKLRSLPPQLGGDTPAAALTGYSTEEDRARASAAGFQRHLGKPIDANELFDTVAALAREAAGQRLNGLKEKHEQAARESE